MSFGKMERAWVALANSSPVRRLRRAARRIGSGSELGGTALWRRRLVARVEARRDPHGFDHLETLCLFVGHVKSGGTLLGAMIDAHPDAVVADEVDVLRHLQAGIPPAEIRHLLVRNARREALKGRVTARRLGGYSVAVPGQWQGRYRQMRVIGESRAGPTTRRLGDHPALLQALGELAHPGRLRMVHVVRNPLDPIAAMVRRGGRTVEAAISDYASQADRLDVIRSRTRPDELITVHYEDMVADPHDELSTVLEYLGLERRDDHIRACERLIDGTYLRERRWVEWVPSQLEAIRRLADRHDYLVRYRDEVDPATRPVES